MRYLFIAFLSSFISVSHEQSIFIQAAMCIWPAISTLNFALVPEKNRVLLISMCSLLWTCFLAYMKQLDIERDMTIEKKIVQRPTFEQPQSNRV